MMKIQFTYEYMIDKLHGFTGIEVERLKAYGNNDRATWEFGKNIDFKNYLQMINYYSQIPLLCNYINWHYGMSINRRRDIANKLHGNVLNYGAGIATESLIANQERGVRNDLLDLDTTTKGFTNYIIKEHNLIDIGYKDYNVIESTSYDFIVCIDVLEHTQCPDELLKWFMTRLKKAGKLIVRAPFHIAEDPSHIQPHGLKIENLLKEAGYEPYQYDIVEV